MEGRGRGSKAEDEWKISCGQTLLCSVIFCRKNSARLKQFTPLLYTSQISKWSSLLYPFYTEGFPEERKKTQLKVTFPNLLSEHTDWPAEVSAMVFLSLCLGHFFLVTLVEEKKYSIGPDLQKHKKLLFLVFLA